MVRTVRAQEFIRLGGEGTVTLDVQITVVRPEELGAGQVARWRSMQVAYESLRNPFLSPEFTLAVGRVRDDARVAVLADGGAEVGFFPFERGALGIGRPIAGGLTYAQGLVGVAGLEYDPRQLLRACGLSVWAFDHLAPDQGPFAAAVSGRFPSPVIDLSDGFDAYLAALRQRSNRFVKELRRKERGLDRDAGGISFVYDDLRTDALHALMRWKSAQYRRTGRPDKFAHRWIVELLEGLLGVRGGEFEAKLSVLYAGDRPVAASFDLRCGPVLAGWFSAYDPDFAKYSPGLILHLKQVEAATGRGVRRIDQGRGPAGYKETLKSFDAYVGEGRVARRSLRAGLHWLGHAPVRTAHNLIVGSGPLRAAVVHALKVYGRVRAAGPARPAVPAPPEHGADHGSG